MMKRLFDIAFSIFFILVLIIPMVIIACLIIFSSGRPVIYYSDRIGINNKIFKMPKFRSMKKNTPPLATHLISNPEKYLLPIGGVLRKYSLDELPQIFSILRGDMSFVGPRPALFNQYDLIDLRIKYKIDTLKPGLTGLAQINGRDNLSIEDKVRFEIDYLNRQSFYFDSKILWMTFLKVFFKKDITH